MKILFTFTGFHDPYFKGLIEGEEQRGPILSLLSAYPCDCVYLFETPNTQDITAKTQEALRTLCPATHVETLSLEVDDPTDYQAILKGLRDTIRPIIEGLRDANLFIAVASGTPQMHACWLLLAASGEIPARILHVRPPRFVTKDRPVVTEIDLAFDEFPTVRFPACVLSDNLASVPEFRETAAQLGIVGDHATMDTVLETVAMLAPSQSPILVLGETGTGKELFARLIHRLSGCAQGPFVPVNCAAIPEDLVESLLFGHKKGAFTGAATDQPGKFDAANNGTLFLDELGELPMAAQAKLLRVLQDGVVEPIGARSPHRVNVRVVAATNKDLAKLIRKGQFREDLYYRLNVGEVRLPPLRERRSDIPKLALAVLDRLNASLHRPKRFTQEALARLQAHNWPGNVRDLENVVERSARLCRNAALDADDLLINEPITYADPLDALPEPHEGFSLDGFLGSARKQLILRALEIAQFNQSQAARLLGMTPQAVHNFLKQKKDMI